MLRPRCERCEARQLGRYWAELQHDGTARPPAGLDPAIAEVVARLDRAARPPEPRAAFLEQLWQRLVTSGSSPPTSASEETDDVATITGTSAGPVDPWRRRSATRSLERATIDGVELEYEQRGSVMKSQKVTGGGGVQLHIVEAGNPRGRPILFIHGFSQCWLAWSRQMSSDLADDYRLVAMDMRGHGLSEKPREGYDDSRLWADDVGAVIRALSLDHPVLCGWSYGSLVILDYLRHHGEDGIGGLNFVDGITKLGSDEAASVIAPEFLSLLPGFFATDVEESVRSLESLLRMCFAQQPSSDELYLMLGYNVAVPPYVRQALFSRSFDNGDLLPKIRKPALLMHGAEDAIVSPAVVDQHKAGMAHAQIRVMANAGHAPFWDDAATFNQHLRAFCESL